MSTYAIGDIQGCFEALNLLLDEIGFDAAHDRLWLVGDLVNRGPHSAEVLRWAMALGDRVTTVLGNHDLHLLAVAEGCVPARRNDTIRDVLTAPDRAVLLDWLRQQKLMHVEQGWALVHAGLLPQWSVAQALALAQEVEAELQGPHYRHFLQHMYGNEPDRWHDDLTGIARLRVITNGMTRLRFCTAEGAMEFVHKGSPAHPPPGCMPWYQVPTRASREANIVFGHWSAHGLDVSQHYCALDTGCLWGGKLSALRLEDRQVFQIPCAGLASSRPLR